MPLVGRHLLDRGMKKQVSLVALSGALLFLPPLLASEVRAQSCEGLSGENEVSNDVVTGCLKPVVNYRSLINVSDIVRRVVAGELVGQGETEPEPAGLLLASPEEIAARLAGGGVTVEPTADVVAAPAAQRKWNAWIDGKYSWIEGSDDLDGSKGPLINAMAGIDYRLSDRVVLGLIGTYEDSRLKTQGLLPVKQTTEGFGGGAYTGITVTPNIVFSAIALYSGIETKLDYPGFGAGETDSDRVQLSSAFTGYWYFGTTRLSPSATLAWSKEWQDEYSNNINPAQRFETGVLTGGTVLGHTFALSGTTSVEPWAGAFLDYTFLNETHTDGLGTDSVDEQADLRLQLGLNLNLASNVQLALTGETAGLIVDETDSYAGEANLAIQF
jgi:outer membrane autotransporter protein